jgi:hypothetical protein
MKKIITLLENLTNKKVVLENSVFKSRKMDERLISFKKELEKSMIIDEPNKTIIINKNIKYPDCLVLEKFYQGYLIDVKGDVDVSCKELKQLPLINFNKITGSFCCNQNQLTSLQYSPKEVDRSFLCYNNQLTSLQYSPTKVGRSFWCSNNQLTSLKYCPKEVGRNFLCFNNQLINLQYCPKEVGGSFSCYNNSKKFTKEDVEKYCKVGKKIE